MDAIQEQISRLHNEIDEKTSRLQADIMEIKTSQAIISNNFAHLQQQLIEFATSVRQLKTVVNYTTFFGAVSIGVLIGAGILHAHLLPYLLQLAK